MDATHANPPLPVDPWSPDPTVANGATRPRQPRPWLPPVVVGAVAALGLTALWISIYLTPPCRIGTVGFGLLVLLVSGLVALVGVWFAIDSEQVRPRRRGKALLLGGLTAMALFLVATTVLTWILPLFSPAC